MPRKASSDRASSVAFDRRAPQRERTEALTEIQKAYAPRSLSDMLLPRKDMMEVISWINRDLEDQEVTKSLAGGKVVPFPSKHAKEGARGMQSVRLDNLQITAMGDYWEKPTAFGFDAMRDMVTQTPVLNAVILTRIRQVMRFCHVNETGEGPGFVIRHVDKDHQATPTEQESIKLLQRFMANCGWEFNPRERKKLYREAFPQMMSKLVRDSLTMDSCAIETEMKRNRALGIDGIYAVDGATVRLCTEQGYEGDDRIFAVQVVQGRISAAYGHDDLIYEPRNPVSDVLSCGYGIGETELMIRVVTGFLNAMTYNIRGFDSNAIPKGLLHLSGNYDDNDLNAFKRYWNAQVKGVNNAWALPTLISKDQDSKASFEKFGVEFNEMYFAKWMSFLTSIICAIYGMSPAEINFDSFTSGNTSALAGSDTDEKLANSKDSGLWPVLSYFQGIWSDYVVSAFSDKYCFRFTGLDEDDSEKREERARLILTVNEMRAADGYDKYPGPDIGDAPVNASLISPWLALKQAAEAAAQGQDFGQVPGEAPGHGDKSGDSPGESGGQPGDGSGAPGEGGPPGGGPNSGAQVPPGQQEEGAVQKSMVLGLGLPSGF
jgi:hypothetical protein